ncbi:uncharacterized protein At3g27210-like [Zingiber officinale]|uniref:Uncharacterized protein n=1 Tax=Zingiber officinale TaxID=94328 RepID=A0A8J5FTL7_ZINOF|nr:uncharacterized protein At3g27210-like [Zingiber officinale]XP_042416884.1 uncharacterized protein At3g27210-like [Zingiber officinale]KAG6489552.1 hypothetical protein ZIOFF_050827 [Zingiber officinale]KAG6492705.1 hypothetical protein ZIOFF_047670 [Zingiber officinale]
MQAFVQKNPILKMGVCTSIPKDSDASSMRYRLGLTSKAKRLFLPSPAKEKALDGANPVHGFGSQTPEFGSKNKIFFDTQAWFDSDCDDDFFSVNGEFTPSRGSTPIHPSSTPSTPKLDNHFLFDKSPYSKSDEPSPTGRKKLAELLRETSQIEKLDSSNITEVKEDANEKSDIYKTSPAPTPNSLNATSYRSGASSACSAEVTPSSDRTSRKDKAWKTGHCCLPSLQSFGIDERRQKMSPSPCAA